MQRTKRCPICGENKPLSEYHRFKDGYQAYCKVCRRAYNQKAIKRKPTPTQAEKEAESKSRKDLAKLLAELRDKHKIFY